MAVDIDGVETVFIIGLLSWEEEFSENELSCANSKDTSKLSPSFAASTPNCNYII